MTKTQKYTVDALEDNKDQFAVYRCVDVAVLETALDQAIKDKDEARREICTAKARLIFSDAMTLRDRAIYIAKDRGWDCFEGSE